MTIDTLRELLPDIVDDAVDDAELLEKDPRYKLAMTIWHEPAGRKLATEYNFCYVCLAGATIARRLGVSAIESVQPSSFETEIYHKLLAIDMVRVGELDRAYNALGQAIPPNAEAVGEYIRSNSTGIFGRASWRIYRQAMKHLREGTMPS